jgi:hypothetical protein
MMVDYFDKHNLLRIIWRKLKNLASEKDINMTKWASNVQWLWQWDLSLILNWKKWVSSEKLIVIAEWIWIWKKELDKIVAESKKEELQIYHWQDLEIIPSCNLNTLKDLDFDDAELLKIVFKREFWKDATEEDIAEIKKFIKYKASN